MRDLVSIRAYHNEDGSVEIKTFVCGYHVPEANSWPHSASLAAKVGQKSVCTAHYNVSGRLFDVVTDRIEK